MELDNGSKLYWFKEESKNVGLALLIPFGSIYEDKSKRGITHLLEHLLFKSNRKYSAKEMNRIIELSGGEWNASTYWDSFVIQAEFLSSNYKRVLDVFESVVTNDKFLNEEFEKEKEVVLTEIKEQMNDPLSKLYSLVRRSVYGDSDLGAPIGGYPETVEDLTLHEVEEHKRKIFKSRNAIMVLVGGVSSEIIERAKNLLTSIEEGNVEKKKPSWGDGEDIVVEMDTGDICYLAYGWKLPVLDMFRSVMLEYLMVVGSTSLLYDRIREELGLAYSFGSSSDMTHETGYISFGVEGYHCDKRELVKEILLETLWRIKENKIDRELIKGKKNMIEFGKEKYRHFYAERAEDTARRAYLGKPIESIEFAERLVEKNWDNVGEVVSEGYFVEILPLK